jgi:ketosteroid isomerase-like protein
MEIRLRMAWVRTQGCGRRSHSGVNLAAFGHAAATFKGIMYKPAILSLAFLWLVSPTPSIAGAEADIDQLEEAFNAAYAANQLDKYFGYYTDDAVFWFPEGRTDLPSYRKEWGEFLKAGGGIKAGTVSDLHVKFSPLDDTAIASYVLRLTTREANKKVHTEDYQETDVWFKTDNGWKITHVHYSAAPKPKKQKKG